MDDLGLFASILGHVGDGNFHEGIMYKRDDPKERAAVEDCIHRMVDRALEMEGTVTGEHGVSSLIIKTPALFHFVKLTQLLDRSWKKGRASQRAWSRDGYSHAVHQEVFRSSLVDESGENF